VADNQIAFAVEILKLLAEKPLKKADLSAALSDRGFAAEDLSQKITRMIAKLRDCGFEVDSAPNRPYELVESSFPVILSTEQRQALALAAYFLSDMGFSAQSSQIIRLGKLTEADLPTDVKVNFSPPVDYSEDKLEETVHKLQERFHQQRRYAIRYRSARGNEKNWDCDRSELRFHNGVLYLFAYAPDFSPQNHNVERNQAFRVDRILRVYPSSQTPWRTLYFPTVSIRYRMSGSLGTYQPRRANECELLRDLQANMVEIEAQEDYVFWFQQRILQYGENVQVLEPDWIVGQVRQRLQKSVLNYIDGSTH
jgi:predicted DNA-binding transcriptional regulator YafY